MIAAGALLAAWGALVLWFARPLHAGWRDALRSVRGADVRAAVGRAERAAPERGVVWMRRAALAGVVVGLAISGIGAIVAWVEAM